MFSSRRLKRIVLVVGTLFTFGFATTFANPVENTENNVSQTVKVDTTKDIAKSTTKSTTKDISKNTVKNDVSKTEILKEVSKNVKNEPTKETAKKEILQLKSEGPDSVTKPEVNLVYKTGNNTLPSYNDFTKTAVKTTSAAETAQKEMNKHHSLLQNVLPAALAVGVVYVGQHNWGDLQNKVGVDRVAHFACSYIINDQLQRSFKMSPFMATLTTIAIGAAKERWVDNKWDSGDFAADCLGAIVADIRF